MPYCVSSPSEDLFASYMRKGAWSDAGSTSLEEIRRNINSLPSAADPQLPVDQPQEPLVDPWVANFFANLTNDDFSLVSRSITCSPVAPKVPEQILPSPSAGHGAQEPRFDAVQAPIFMNTTIASNNVAPFSATFSVANQTLESCFRMSPLHQNSLNSRSGAYMAPSSDSTLKSVKSGLESFLEGFPSIPCHPLPPEFSAAEANCRPIVHAVTRQEPRPQSKRVTSLSAASQSNKRIQDSAKDADRRRRNREASSRAYYNRKKRVELLEDKLRAEKRILTSLFARQLQLRKESAILKARLLDI
jgi:hypothetical protein